MAKKDQQGPILKELAEIKQLLQSLLILEGARAGMPKSSVRKMVKVGNQTVTEPWKDLKGKPES